MIKNSFQFLRARRRRRALANIRREFERAGYPLDQFGDEQIEAALTRWTHDVTAVVLNTNAMYHALTQLRSGPTVKRKAELSRAVLPQGR